MDIQRFRLFMRMWGGLFCLLAISCNSTTPTQPLPKEKIDSSVDYCARGMAARSGLKDAAGEGAGEEDLQRGLIQNPNNYACRFAYGRTLTSAGLVNEARAELKRVIAESDSEKIRKEAAHFLEIRLPPLDIPQKAIELNAAGWHASNQEDTLDRAILLLENALALEPRFTWPWNNLARVYYKKKEYSKAIEMARRAIGIAPMYRNAYATLADIFMETRQVDEAITAWEKVLEIDPGDLNAKRNIAWLLIDKPGDAHSDWERARDILEQAAKADPNERWTNMRLAMVRAKLHLDEGRFVEAEQQAQKALALSPEDSPSWGVLGQAYEGQSRLKEAMKAYDTGLHFYPEHPYIRMKRDALQKRMNLERPDPAPKTHRNP